MTDLGFEGDDCWPGASRRVRRGKQALVGLAGLAAMAAGGLFFVTEAIPAKERISPDRGAAAAAPAVTVVPPVEDASPSEEPSADSPYVAPARSVEPSAPVKSGEAPRRLTVPVMSPAMSLDQRVVILRASGAGAALPVPQVGVASAQQAVAAPQGALDQGVSAQQAGVEPGGVAEQDISVIDSGSIQREGATLRVVSAPGDLTGQRELAWVADAGQPVGDAYCSQNFYYGEGRPAGDNPALLVCWHTSRMKSVFTVTVSAVGRPSVQSGVAALDRQWALLEPAPMPSF